MNSAAKDIANILDGESALGLTLGTDLFHSWMPDSPDALVVVYDNPGGPPMLTYKKSTSNYYYSSVSVQARDVNVDDAYASIFAIFDFLHASSSIVEAGTYYALIKALNDPQELHRDQNDRIVMFVNFEVQRRTN